MDNGIRSRQNLPENIQLLAAQRAFYSRAKMFAASQASIAGLCPLLAAVLTTLKPELDVWAAVVGIVVALADTVWLDPRQAELRKCGANTQELFDCAVLKLEENLALKGACPTHEDIYEAAERCPQSTADLLMDWYPKGAAEVPLAQGRVICQRTNLWWDSKLRRRYRGWIIAAVAVVSGLAVCLGVAEQWRMDRFVLSVITPLLPPVMWAIRECKRQEAGAADLDRLREYTEQLWQRVSKSIISEKELTQCSRDLQDAILVGRRERAVVFDWIYSWLRNSQEDQMNVGADSMVAELYNNQTSD